VGILVLLTDFCGVDLVAHLRSSSHGQGGSHIAKSGWIKYWGVSGIFEQTVSSETVK
jgi:hypothetical protein